MLQDLLETGSIAPTWNAGLLYTLARGTTLPSLRERIRSRLLRLATGNEHSLYLHNMLVSMPHQEVRSLAEATMEAELRKAINVNQLAAPASLTPKDRFIALAAQRVEEYARSALASGDGSQILTLLDITYNANVACVDMRHVILAAAVGLIMNHNVREVASRSGYTTLFSFQGAFLPTILVATRESKHVPDNQALEVLYNSSTDAVLETGQSTMGVLSSRVRASRVIYTRCEYARRCIYETIERDGTKANVITDMFHLKRTLDRRSCFRFK